MIPKTKEMLISLLDKTYFHGIRDMDENDQMEIIADTLSIGMMYDSPYEKYDPFDQVAISAKRMFSNIVQDMFYLMAKHRKESRKNGKAISAEADYKKGE